MWEDSQSALGRATGGVGSGRRDEAIVVGDVVADVADDGDGGDTAVGAGVPPPQASDRDHLDSAIIVS